MKKTLLFLIIVIICVSLTGCDSIRDKQLVIEDLLTQFYSFEPDTILTDLHSERNNVFEVISPPPDVNKMPGEEKVDWQQSEFIEIANAIYKTVWQDSPDDYKLLVMGFEVNCADVDKGIQSAVFVYSTYIKKNGVISSIDRTIMIKPNKKYIYVYEEKDTPSGIVNKFINPDDLQVTADQALQIAEQNGGFKTRINNQNNCDVSLSISPNDFYSGWQVSYGNSSDPYLISLHINPQTGKIKGKN